MVMACKHLDVYDTAPNGEWVRARWCGCIGVAVPNVLRQIELPVA